MAASVPDSPLKPDRTDSAVAPNTKVLRSSGLAPIRAENHLRKGSSHGLAQESSRRPQVLVRLWRRLRSLYLARAYTFITFRSIAKSSVDVSDSTFPTVLDLTSIQGADNTAPREDLDLLLCQTPACSTEHNTKRQKNIDAYQAALKLYEPMISYPGERDLYQKFTAAFARYLDISNRTGALLTAGKAGDALDLATADTTVDFFHVASAALDDDLSLNAKLGTEESKAVSQSSDRALWVSSGATPLIVFLCALTGFILTRLIAPPLLAAAAALERVADKDMTVSVEESGTDEIGRHSAALNVCFASMRTVLVSVAQGAETLSAATTEICSRSVQ